jgi:iron complex outermembrane receptor protein
MRMAFYPLADDGYRNIVDLNTIPDSIVDRIDTLLDGASSTYGSDAIAGVVNVIIKKEVQGLHLNMSAGTAQNGGYGEQRFDVTYGKGKLSKDGYNFYVNFEYQKNDALFLNQLGYPYNTANRSAFCNAAGACANNGVLNGIQAGGGYNGFQATQIGFAAPVAYNPATASFTQTGSFQALNPALGCGAFPAQTLTAGQIGATNAPSTVCQEDLQKQYSQLEPDLRRIGGNFRFTKDLGHAQAYVMFNFLATRTEQDGSPENFANQTTFANTTAGGSPVSVANILLPVYVCPQGVGSIDAGGNLVATGCSAANGKLNPNNPFAAQGQLAQLYELNNQQTTEVTNAYSYRIAAGISGDFGSGFTYNLEGTSSWIDLTTGQYNYMNEQDVLNAVAQGTYNFADQAANSVAAQEAIAPPNITKNSSRLTQIMGTLSHDLITLPGGVSSLSVGAAYRFEGINAPTPNGPNEANPSDRYYGINTFAVNGTRRVYSAFYELAVPVFEQLNLKASGGYDDYTTSYSAKYKKFSPKFEAEFKPVKQVKFRGTYSQGYAVPSFNEADTALPLTGFQLGTINCATYASFCAAHASNPSYYAGQYFIGTTTYANPNLQPQKSDSYTLGIVLQPTPRITATADFWHTKISNYIIPTPLSPSILNAYYNQGLTQLPGGISIIPGQPDSQNPAAQPLIGEVVGQFENAAEEIGQGFDFTAAMVTPIGNHGFVWTTKATASYLQKLYQIEADGSIQTYAGLLSPCNISNCSGAPKWRVVWQNSFDFGRNTDVTFTANYTSGYELTATDYGGIAGQCGSSSGFGVPPTFSDGSPQECNAHAQFDLDAHAQTKVADQFTLYLDVQNLLNNKPPYDPAAQYGLTGGFNSAWGTTNVIGRYFRVGVKIDY